MPNPPVPRWGRRIRFTVDLVSLGRAAILIGIDLVLGALLLWLGKAWHAPLPGMILYLGGLFMLMYVVLVLLPKQRKRD